MDDAMLVDLLKQAPYVGVSCFLVVVFLKHMDKRDQDHIQERRETRASLDLNTQAMNRTTEAIGELISLVKK